jgi:hypothetical protein
MRPFGIDIGNTASLANHISRVGFARSVCDGEEEKRSMTCCGESCTGYVAPGGTPRPTKPPVLIQENVFQEKSSIIVPLTMFVVGVLVGVGCFGGVMWCRKRRSEGEFDKVNQEVELTI